MHNANWDDLRFVLAVVEAGTVSGAARALGVNHATVLRRISAFESRYGMTLFDKTAQGYRVPEERMRTIAALREAGAAMQLAEAALAGGGAKVSGALRVTSTDTLSIGVLPGVLQRLAAAEPGLRINLLTSNAHLDLGRMQAEIAIRPTDRLSGELVGEVATQLRFAVYAAPGADRNAGWIVPTGRIGRTVVQDWIESQAEAEGATGAVDSFLTAARMAAAGFGRTVLPCFVGDEAPDLKRLDRDPPHAAVPIWVATHADLAGMPRIRTLRDRLVEELRKEAPRLMGEA